ncbi:AraC family transcriptional regulator [Dyadobacter chenwenxiniae]|uniref:AraC family transcriptional regulator n=1 Tax=Dyadobacter chenwenxiniae TaxID=2906456 RepID=A0A9X1PGI1_9BACT|nr:AraC family transcriptional regulator [Dyadobacter chenwenxiniae]MCF0060181.1 AraC family transcriptional regulator [Dyadobacter chenwenxiniae]UON85918.1 AraC family transcriptional regulator [Dyadobacter chenwenxiniae]
MEDQQEQFVLGIVAYAVQRDISATQLCKLSGISLPELTGKNSITFSAKQLNDLWLNACHLSNDPLFGLHLGESLQLAALGVVGEIVKTSTTVGNAVSIATSLTGLVTDLFKMEVRQSERRFTINLIPNQARLKDSEFAFKQTLDFFMVFLIHELDGFILEKIKPEEARLPFTASAAKEYTRLLRCEPLETKDEYALTFDSKYWDLPIITANYELQTSLLQNVNLLELTQAESDSYRARIYQYLLKNAYLGIVSLEEIAANFNVSPRSLQRKLKDENVTYQEVADEVRKALALNYLSSGKYLIKEISYMLGYNELSAFSRAFKRWTGTTPGSYQKNAIIN